MVYDQSYVDKIAAGICLYITNVHVCIAYLETRRLLNEYLQRLYS